MAVLQCGSKSKMRALSTPLAEDHSSSHPGSTPRVHYKPVARPASCTSPFARTQPHCLAAPLVQGMDGGDEILPLLGEVDREAAREALGPMQLHG